MVDEIESIPEDKNGNVLETKIKTRSRYIVPFVAIIFLFLGSITLITIIFPKNKNNISNRIERKSSVFEKIGNTEIDKTIKVSASSNVVDTNQTYCFNSNKQIPCGKDFDGQDAQYLGNSPKYKDNKDGTVTDLNTNLMWVQLAGDKSSYYDTINSVKDFSFAGYSDWRVPTIKELYSIIDFSGVDIPSESTVIDNPTPFINTDYFDFKYGDLTKGDRIIDSQWITSTIYVAKVMNGDECFFGVNFADGRIKCYPTINRRNNGYYVRLVRGNTYGENIFVDNGNGTVTDKSTQLTWQKDDSKKGMDWEDALAYCENLRLANIEDWRLPNAKELQYIVDYSRSPGTTNSAAIDPVFLSSLIINEAKEKDFPFYWTGTTHIGTNNSGSEAVYISFGRALGYMNGKWIDVHGAGAQRSDPKSGNIKEFPTSKGPQGDVRRLHNYVRCVTGGDVIKKS